MLYMQSYFDTLLNYVCSVTFFEAAVLKDLDPNTLVKCG